MILIIQMLLLKELRFGRKLKFNGLLYYKKLGKAYKLKFIRNWPLLFQRGSTGPVDSTFNGHILTYLNYIG